MTVKNIQFTEIEIKIVKYIFKHYQDKRNARQLAKLLGINHAHANELCKGLVKKNLLVKEELGNAVYFSFNYKDKSALNFMEYVLSLEEFPKWLAVIMHALGRFKQHIKMGLVFGSSIKSKDFNDIDVLLMYEQDKKDSVNNVKEEVRKAQLVDKPVRYVDITEKDIKLNKDDKIFYSILSESKVFHNPEKYVEAVKKCRKLKTT